MTPNIRPAFRQTLAALAVLLISANAFANALPEGKPGAGDPAPTFSVFDIKGGKVNLAEILKGGKVVLLNFWGVRCSSCIEEIGYLNPLAEKYAAEGVVFLGVNVDGIKVEMLNKQMPTMPTQPKYTILPDPEFKIPDLYNLSAAPLSFVIGKDGIIKYRHEDFKPGDEKEIEEALKKALSGK
jgi:peroxiredoxin